MYTNVYKNGSRMYVRERDDVGDPVYKVVDDFEPEIYIPGHDPSGEVFEDFRQTVKLKRVLLSPNLSEAYRDLKDRRVAYGTRNFHHQYIQRMYGDYTEFSQHKDRIHIGIIDIEVYSPDEFPDPQDANHPINAITLYSSKTDTYYLFHTMDCSWCLTSELEKITSGDQKPDQVKEMFYASESDLLRGFLDVWSEDYPDVISGWNSDIFDYPYIYNRLCYVFGEKSSVTKSFSPYNYIRRTTKMGRFGNEEHSINILGIEILDYLALYLKHTFKKRESYKLDYISYVELGEKKVEYDEDALHKLADADPVKFLDYNFKDAWLIKKLNEKLNLFELVIDLAYLAGINYEETNSPVKLWDNTINNYLLERNLFAPVDGLNNEVREFAGAYVYDDLKEGLLHWVVSFDLTSLYPSIIRQWNLGPDTITASSIEGRDIVDDIMTGKICKQGDREICLAANGTAYRTDKVSFLNALMTSLFNERDRSKDVAKAAKQRAKDAKTEKEREQALKEAAIFGTRQLALKVVLNSGYGAFGNQYFRFFDVRVAEAITLSGQLVSKWVFRDLNNYINGILKTEGVDYVAAGDTDSVYLTLGGFVDRFMANETDEQKICNFMDTVSKKIVTDCIEPSYRRLQEVLGCREQLMHMDREVIASDGFWRGKKNYALRILDSEGYRYEKPEYKIMGLEPARSTYRESDRKAMEKAIHIILDRKRGATNQDLIDHVAEYREAYKKKPYSEIGHVIRVSKIQKYIDGKGARKGTPANSKAAINYNNLLDKHNITRMPHIEEGDQIYMLELYIPNITPFDVIGHKGTLPKEFGIDKYLNYESMFERNVFKPISSYCEAVGWKSDDSPDLGDFFA